MKLIRRMSESQFAVLIWQKRFFVMLGLAGVSMLFLSFGLYVMYNRYQMLEQLITSQTQLTDKEADEMLIKVGTLMSLPSDEKPTIATISDTQKLASQPFFINARIGDKVLIFNSAKKVILYRPEANKIINVAPLGSGGEVAGDSTVINETTPTASPSLRVAIYNGTTIPKLAVKASKRLEEKLSDITVVAQTNAAAEDYTKTKIIDISGIAASKLSQIADVFSAEEVVLPTGETAPKDADVLVILGTDAE